MKIEVGAASGAFRARFFPDAITTDVCPGTGIDILANAEALPFKSESLDLIIANNPFGYGFRNHFFISEVARTLKPGGQLIVNASVKNRYVQERTVRKLSQHYGFSFRRNLLGDQYNDFIFRKTSGEPTKPSHQFILTKQEP